MSLCWGLSLAVGTVQANLYAVEVAQAASFEFSPAERIEQVLTLPETGRYTFIVQGEQPVNLQLVDRMNGPYDRAIGRVDALLDAGEVKVLLFPVANATGKITLEVKPYQEVDNTQKHQLPVGELVITTLPDTQQQSYWLSVPQKRWVSIEMAGRYLADVRLWRDGEWLESLRTEVRRTQPVPGQPLQAYFIHTELEPGLYRLTAYGGPTEPWTVESDESPLYIRKGLPELPAYGWWDQTASPFGVDRWRLASNANHFQLSLPEAQPAQLNIQPLTAGTNPYQPGGRSVSIAAESRLPEASLNVDATQNQERLLTVVAEAGKPYRLAYFALRGNRDTATTSPGGGVTLGVNHSRAVWLSIVGLSNPEDTLDATVLAYDRYRSGNSGDHTVNPVSQQMPQLDRNTGWEGRFNLMETVDLFFEVTEGGPYQAEVPLDSEAMVEFKIEPLIDRVPDSLGTTWRFSAQAQWELARGHYRLSMRPGAGHAGIARVRLHHQETDPESIKYSAPLGRDAGSLGVIQQPDRTLAVVNKVSNHAMGIMVRDFPIRLDAPLPVSQQASSVRALPLFNYTQGRLVAQTAQGDRLPLSLNEGGPWVESLDFAESSAWAQRRTSPSTTLYVHNPNNRPVNYNLVWLNDLPKPKGVTALQDSAILTQGSFVQRLSTGEPHWLQLPERSARHFDLNVDQPGLYRLESLGLLDTRGQVRTRSIINLAHAEDGAPGRNFLIQRYLRQGEYRVTLASQGRSAGDTALQLQQTPVRDGGTLSLGARNRTTVSNLEAVRYLVHIDQAGQYQVQAVGLRHDFAFQLTDANGWPMIRPGSQTPQNIYLPEGEYSLTILPQPVSARALIKLEAVTQANAQVVGHGPHLLGLNRQQQALWREPEAEAERTPDSWTFSAVAPMTTRVVLTEGMAAVLEQHRDHSWHSLGAVELGRSFTLAPGDYRLQVRSEHPDDRKPYSVMVHTEELPLGQSRDLSIPGSLTLSLAEPRLVQLSAFSRIDVEATLYDADNNRVAYSDGRPDDWNFLISRELSPGRYRLQVDGRRPDGSPAAPGDRVSVQFSSPSSVTVADLSPGESRTLVSGQSSIIPLTALSEPGIQAGLPLILRSESKATHGIALQRWSQPLGEWQTLGTSTGRKLLIGYVIGPEEIGRDYRLRIWPLEDTPEAIELYLTEVNNANPVEHQRQSSLALSALDEAISLSLIQADTAGLMRTNERDHLLFASPGEAFREARGGWIGTSQNTVWLLSGVLDQTLTLESQTVPLSEAASYPVGASMSIRASNAQDPAVPRLWLAEGSQHTPSLRPEVTGSRSAWAVAQQSAIAVVLPGTELSTLTLQRADGDTTPLTTRVSEQPLTMAGDRTYNAEEPVIQVPPHSALRLVLDGQDELRITLPAQMAALVERETTPDLYWSGQQATTFTSAQGGRALWLMNPSSTATTTRVSTRSLHSAKPVALTNPAELLSVSHDHGGVWMLTVPARPEDGRLYLAGGISQAYLLTDDGYRAELSKGYIEWPSPEANSARLVITHQPGRLGVWTSARRQGEWTQQQDLNLEAPSLVTLSADGPTLFLIEQAERPTAYLWLSGADTVHRLMPAGEHRIRLVEVGATTVTARIETQALQPWQEGVGETRVLAPGQAEAFHLRLAEPGAIGLAVRATPEAIDVSLQSTTGDVLGEGLLQKHDHLPAGDYALVVRLDADASAVTFAPVLLGTETPGDLVPIDVIERFTSWKDAP